MTEAEGRAALLAGRALGGRYRLAVPREALRGAGGTRLGTQAGASLDFHDYRSYQPGDDLRHLDWGVYARSDREVVKLFREEVSPKLDVVLDDSRSMALEGTRKAAAALGLAAALAAAADNARFTREVWLAGAEVEALAGSRGDVAGWRVPEFGVVPAGGAGRLAGRWRRFGMRVLVSDLLWEVDPATAVRALADGAASLTVVQVLAREEVEPGLRGQWRLEDSETGEEWEVFADEGALAAYGAALARLREGWSAACRAAGARFVTVVAEDFDAGGRLGELEREGLLEGN